jgi:acyl-CoA synthetase (NDP forming)
VGSTNIWNAVFSQTNTIQVRTFEELMDTTMAFYYSKEIIPKIKNKGILLISWSGGNATIATDLITQMGAEVPEFSETTKEKLKKMIRFGGVANPLDLPWKNFSDEYSKIAKIAISEPTINCIIAESYKPAGDDKIIDNYYSNLIFLKDLCLKLDKPFFVSLPFTNYLGGARETYKRKIIELGVPIFPSFERAAKAYLNMYNFQKKR